MNDSFSAKKTFVEKNMHFYPAILIAQLIILQVEARKSIE